MKRALAIGLLALVGLSCFAQTNPYIPKYVDMWKVVQDVRAAFKIATKPGIVVADLATLDLFLDSRQLSSLYDAFAARALSTAANISTVKITLLADLANVKYMGASSLAMVLIFYSFTDELTVGPVVVGKVKQ